LNDESAPKGASANTAVAAEVLTDDPTVAGFLAGNCHAHELPWDLWLLWSDGFHAGQNRAQARVDRANREADWWYYVAQNPAEVRAEHERTLKAFDVAQARKKAVTA
jgi:hypothetical protein